MSAVENVERHVLLFVAYVAMVAAAAAVDLATVASRRAQRGHS